MNDANVKVFSLFVDPAEVWQEIGGRVPNIIRLVLHPNGLRPHLIDWYDLALYFIANLEKELETNPYNSEAKELIDEIRAYPDMPETKELTGEFRPYLEVTAKKDDIELKLFTVVSTFGTPQDVTLQELRIETFFPAGEATEKYL